MSFNVAAEAYDRFMGRYSTLLAPQLADLAGVLDGESLMAGTRQGHLAELFEASGMQRVEEAVLSADLEHPSFEEWWEPFAEGVGPAGSYVAGLDPDRQAALRERCRAMLPVAPFVQTARAWAARGRA